MSRLRRLVLSDRLFFVTCKTFPGRKHLGESEFALLAGVNPIAPESASLPGDGVGVSTRPLARHCAAGLSDDDFAGHGIHQGEPGSEAERYG
jgi:hypothetical protein